MTNAKQVSPREAVGVFIGADDLKHAGQELLNSGFERTALGILAGKEAVEKSLGDLYVRANAFSKHPDAPHMELVRHEAMGTTVHAWLGGLSLAGTTALGAVVVASSAVLGGALIAAAAGAAAVGSVGMLMRAIIHESDGAPSKASRQRSFAAFCEDPHSGRGAARNPNPVEEQRGRS